MSQDLSVFHEPLSDIFAPPSADSSACSLSPAQIEFFHENGYLAGVQILNEAQTQALRAELENLMKAEQAENPLWYEFHLNESADNAKILFHALGAWRVSVAFHDLLWHTAFTLPASQLLGGAVRFWHDQLFIKSARHGGVVAWHQDYSYWTRTAPVAHLTCWIGLDDASRENGCVYYVPRSHKWNLLPKTGLANDMNAVYAVLNDEQKRGFQPVPIELKAGEASFHHPLLVHGSFENFSDQPRRATVINVFRDGVKSASDAPLLAGVPPIATGEKINGQYFPLLCCK